MKKRLICMLLMCMLLPGCARHDPAPTPTPLIQISAAVENTPATQTDGAVRLYFRYRDTAFLSAESREIVIPHGDSPEKAVVQALLDGPSAGSTALNSLFPPGVKILSAAYSEDTLFLTFSEELLGRYTDEPGGTGNQEFINRRKLCMAALANTLTECGFCTRIQVLVDREMSSVTSLRLPASFYRDTVDETPLGPISRDESVILTPYNTAHHILDGWMQRNHSALYAFVAAVGGDQSPRPGLQSAYQVFDHAPLLTTFSLSSGVVSEDGQRAVLSADLTLRINETDVQIHNYPLHLVQENGLWKIQFDQLTGLFDARN